MKNQPHDYFAFQNGAWELLIFSAEGTRLADFRYPKWYSGRVLYTLREPEVEFEIRASNFWGTQFEVLRSDRGQRLGEIRSNWLGRYRLIVGEEGGEKEEFVLRRRMKMLRQHYELISQQKEVVLSFDQRFSWREFRTEYQVQWGRRPSNQGTRLLLMGMAFYAIKRLQRQQGAA